MKSNVQNWPALNIFSESIDFDPIVLLVSLNHKRLITALILFVLSLTVTQYAQSEPIVFARMTNPTGVAVDQEGNVYIQSLSLPEFGGGLFKFDANGVLMARNNQLFEKYRLALDPLRSVLWAQETSGKLYYIDPATLQAHLYKDLRTWLKNNNQQPVLNMLTQKFDPLIMISPSFGDISLRQVGTDQFDLFITGLTNSGGGIPFVLRLRFKNQTPTTMKIMATSIPKAMVIPPPLNAYPYGIAVNNSGTVLTAMPDQIDEVLLRTPLFLATFGADFPETGDAPPMWVQPYQENNNQAFAIGMTASDENDGFYVVTVANGYGCGAGPAILYLPPTLDNATCIEDLSSLGLGNVAPADIAIGPDNRFLYVTMTPNNLVLRLDLPLPPPLPTVSLSATPSVVNYLGSTRLDWSSTDATSCAASGGWAGAQPLSGNQALTGITTTQTYMLTCIGSGGTASQSVTVTVNSTSLADPIECLFNWAEKNYPSLFAPSLSPTQVWTVYTYRYYSATNAYLAVNSTNNHVFYMGQDGSLQDEGPLSYWSPLAGCQVPPPPPTECLFNWAEKNYPSLFAPSGSAWAVSSINWTYRYYKDTNAYLEVNSTDVNLINNHIFYMGADGQLQDEGPISKWLPQSSCQ